MEHHFDIIVVGCGPVGAIAALLLSERGFAVAVVEKNANPYPYPRAIALNGFTMNIIQNLLGDTWERFDHTAAVEVQYVLSKDRMDEPFGKMEPPVIDGKVLDLDNYGFINWFNQPQLETLLREKIAERDNITTFYNHGALIMWEAERTHLKIEELSSGKTVDLSGKYLLGADGGGSFVRKQMGAPLKRLGEAISFLIVDISAPREALQPGKDFDAGGHQIIDPEGQRPTTFLICEGREHGSYKNTFRFEFALKPQENYAAIQSPESIRALISPYLAPDKIQINRSTVYKFNSLISQKWRLNNIFTVGDATHQTSPFIGQGLNMGIRNTYNLIGKIELVEKGLSHISLLDSYQTECYPDSEFIIKQSLFMGKMLFNIKPYANVFRSLVHFFKGGKGKPIDLFPEFVPKTIVVPNGFSPDKLSQKSYPMYNYMTHEGFPRSLRTHHAIRYRVLCKDSSAAIDRELKRVPQEIMPLSIALSDGSSGQATDENTLQCAQRSEDLKMHANLFKNADYVLMAPGYTMIGTYQKGEELKLISNYLSRFQLKNTQNLRELA